MSKRNAAVAVVAGMLCLAVLNLPASITVGSDGAYRVIRMPLYVKWVQFISRHYEYARIAKEITAGCKNDEEKALAILKWTHENIKDVPSGMPVCDDHILNIIIRGYGVPGQFQDVFTTLCVYSGIPAFYSKVYDATGSRHYLLSFVRIGGKWRVLDAYAGVYFRNIAGSIADAGDIRRDHSIVSGRGVDTMMQRGLPYKEFYYGITLVSEPRTLRAEKQMPVQRLFFEARQYLAREKEID